MAQIVLGTINAKWIHPSLALRLLKANLPPVLGSNRNCTILEFALRQNLADKVSAILAEKPEILALSVSIWNHNATAELLDALKTNWIKTEKPVIILGGPELSPLPPETTIFDHVDFVISGEGEHVFARLCQDIANDLPAAKAHYGKIIDADPVNLNTLKSAYDVYSEEDIQRKLIYVESSRGCPYNCAFCQCAVTDKSNGSIQNVREFPLEPFLHDLEKLLQRCRAQKKTVKFLDRSFNVNIPRALKILEFCLEKTSAYKNDSSLQFHFEMVPHVFPVELQNILTLFPRKSLRLEIGIQSFNSQTNTLINRVSNPQKELELLRFLREKTKAIVHADLIAGLPGENLTSFGLGFDRLWTALSTAHNSALFEIQLGILKCLPGTPIWTMANEGRFKVSYNKAPPYEVIETDCLPKAEMDKLKNFARFWEIIINRRAFPDLLPHLTPPGEAVFDRFMELSQELYQHFGKNYGIAKQELEKELKNLICWADHSA